MAKELPKFEDHGDCIKTPEGYFVPKEVGDSRYEEIKALVAKNGATLAQMQKDKPKRFRIKRRAMYGNLHDIVELIAKDLDNSPEARALFPSVWAHIEHIRNSIPEEEE